MLSLIKLFPIHDFVHTEENGVLSFLISNKFLIYNNDDNFLDGYLIVREAFHTDMLKRFNTTSKLRQFLRELLTYYSWPIKYGKILV